MTDQTSLPGLGADIALCKPAVIPRRPGQQLRGYTLFVAIFPEQEVARRLAACAAGLRSQHGFDGNCLPAERLHITLLAVESARQPMAQAVVDATIAAAAGIEAPPLSIVMDRALSLRASRGGDRNPFVLCCDGRSNAAIAVLRQSLLTALRRAGLRPKASTTPHMTVLYDGRVTAEHPLEPVGWTATRFALILSHVGLHHHQQLGCWTLTDRR